MIQNMILQGVGGGSASTESPSSCSRNSSTGALTLQGVTHKPFCIMWHTTGSNSTLSCLVYCEDGNGNTFFNRAYSKSGSHWSQITTTGTITPSYDSNNQTLTIDVSAAKLTTPTPASADIYLFYS